MLQVFTPEELPQVLLGLLGHALDVLLDQADCRLFLQFSLGFFDVCSEFESGEGLILSFGGLSELSPGCASR